MKKILRFLLIVVAIAPALTLAQPRNPIFYRLLSGYGFISDRTTCVHQDHMGFIWIGTEEGLSRYIKLAGVQGDAFIDYTKISSDSTSLTNDYIKVIYQDSQKRLWIGTRSGLNRYNFNSNSFTLAGADDQVFKTAIFNTIEERNGMLWCGTDDGFTIFDPLEDSVIARWQGRGKDGKPIIVNELTNRGGKILAGTSNGLYSFSNPTDDPKPQFSDYNITSIEFSKAQTLLGTSANGILKIGEDQRMQHFRKASDPDLNDDHINDIKKLNDGTIWIASNEGINVMDESANKIIRSYQYDFNEWLGISDPVIRKIFQDKEDGIWLTTPLGGVSLYHSADNLFQYYTQKTATPQKNELLDFSVLSAKSDDKSAGVWLGSRNGLSIYHPDRDEFTHYPFDKSMSNNQIHSITFGKFPQIWIGTDKGLMNFDRQSGSFNKVPNLDLDDKVNVVYTDSEDRIWIGTQSRGLYIWDPDKPFKQLVESGPENNPQYIDLKGVNDIVQRADGRVWIGTNSGIYYYENAMLKQYGPKDDDHNGLQVNHFALTDAQDLIISTRHEGILKVNSDNKFGIFADKKSGLSTNNIASSVYDRSRGEWWISGDKGVSRMKLGEDGKYLMENFNVYDGLQGTQFTSKAGAYTDGKILFGGLGGLTLFDPGKIILRKYPLDLVFTKLSVNGKVVKSGDDTGILTKEISVTDSLVFDPEHETISIEFQGIDYLRPDSLIYKYKLENFDKDWLQSVNNVASYTNLEHGKDYTLRVLARSRLRNWSEEIRMHIYVIPYFYETLWFRVLVAAMVLGLILLIVYLRELRSRRKRAALEKLIDARTHELKQLLVIKEQNARELALAAEEAKKADKAKSEFLAKISHEMRTPLNGIMGLAQMAKEEEQNGELIDLIHSSSKSLKGIIDDLLDLGKIEFERLEIFNETFDLRKLIADLKFSFVPQIREKDIELITEIDPEIPDKVQGDLLRIRQVLVNLIGNGVKFTDSGHVKLTLKLVESDDNSDKVRFIIEDTGIGIPESKRNLIFDSFEQIDNGLSRKYGGTGLGLAISQRLVVLMGGTITVSGSEPHGSVFQFDLDMKKAEEEEGESSREDINLPGGHRILLVEDNPTNVMVATRMIKKTGQIVEVAVNGRDALARLENSEYDLILMDIQMPVMDGFEATKAIRKTNSSYRDIPIVALTAGVMKEDVQKCFDNGMNGFLSKPVDFDELKITLSKFLIENERSG